MGKENTINSSENYHDRKAAKSSRLNDRQNVILKTMLMQKSTKQTLQFLKDLGFPISERILRRKKQIIKAKI